MSEAHHTPQPPDLELRHAFGAQALAGRASEAIETFLQRAAWRGERALAWVRVALMGLVLLQQLALEHQAILQAQPKPLVVLVAATLAALFSLPALRPPRASTPLTPRLVASVLLDVLVVATLFTPAIIWPDPGYLGILRTPYMAGFMVSTAAVGLRLSRRAAAVGVAANAAAVAAMIAADLLLNPALVRLEPFQTITLAVVFTGAALIGWVAAARTRSLVTEGVQAIVQAERTRQRLGAYISEELVGVALDERADLDAEGRRQPIAVLFSDLRGFTTYAERLPPERLVNELNAYLQAMVEAIRAEGGVVDKYIGDAIMVVFGVPSSANDDALRALRTAGAMQRALAAHNNARAAQHLPPLAQGIGVHYGHAVAGNIGTPTRLQYTVIGDVVNVASRLESSTKTLQVGVLVSAEAADAARASGEPLPPLRPLGPLEVKGRAEPLQVFTLDEGAA